MLEVRSLCGFMLASIVLAGCGLDLTNGGFSCIDDGRCPPGYHCAADQTCWQNGREPDLSAGVGGPGGPLPDGGDGDGGLGTGQLCQHDDDCGNSGLKCADGVCCNEACTDSCKSCNQVGALGICSPLAAGANPAHGTCGPDPTTSCGRDGTCDGAGQCRKYGNSVECKPGSCDVTTNQETPVSRCDGAGACVTPAPLDCGFYVCNGSACWANCTSPAQCKNMTACNSGQCGPKGIGLACVADGECALGHCVDGVCCDTAATDCNGCQQCNLGANPGHCMAVPSGQDPHTSCATDASNCVAGGCNGSGACLPASNSVTCAASCGSVNQLTVTKCNGVSTGCTNAPTTSACPSSLVCASAAACYANCATAGDTACASGNYCAGGNCTAKNADGSTCTAADQCSSGVCSTFHVDSDGDGYGGAATVQRCGTTAPAGYVSNANDCCDTDARAHPGQTIYYTATDACGSWDYNCSGGNETDHATGSGSCSTSGTCSVSVGLSCSYTAGWVGTAPACGATGSYYNGCAHAASCTPCQDPGGCGAGCGQANIGTITMGCH